MPLSHWPQTKYHQPHILSKSLGQRRLHSLNNIERMNAIIHNGIILCFMTLLTRHYVEKYGKLWIHWTLAKLCCAWATRGAHSFTHSYILTNFAPGVFVWNLSIIYKFKKWITMASQYIQVENKQKYDNNSNNNKQQKSYFHTLWLAGRQAVVGWGMKDDLCCCWSFHGYYNSSQKD